MGTIAKFNSILAAALVALSTVALAGVDTETDKNDVILAGYDAVAYFTENQPVLGSEEYTAVHNDAIYRFSSAKNRDLFNQNPEKYAPAYGGYCAYGTFLGKKFEVDGKAFEVVDGVLYVNKNRSVYKTWKEDVPKHIAGADAEWVDIEFVAPEDL